LAARAYGQADLAYGVGKGIAVIGVESLPRR